MQRERMRMILYGVPLFLQQDIWPGITSKFGRGKEEDDSAEAFFKALETELMTQRDKYREKTDLFIRSLTGDGLLDEEDAGELKTAIMKVYDYSPEELLEKVKANIENDSTERDNGLDYEKPDTLFPKIRSALPYGEDIGKEDILDLIRQKKEYYTSLMKEDEKPGDYRRRMQETDKVTIRLNKAMLETNPNERYNIRQMSMLHDIRRSVRAGKAVACSTDTNVLSVLDVRLYNGRWFLLVRDPHNIDSIEYTKGQDGEINSRRYLRDPGEKLLWYDRGRHSDGTVLSAVLGTSWWELKDFDKEIGSYLIGPERK
jgi:hypothetical protein